MQCWNVWRELSVLHKVWKLPPHIMLKSPKMLRIKNLLFSQLRFGHVFFLQRHDHLLRLLGWEVRGIWGQRLH